MLTLNINGQNHALDVEPDTPLLWALRDTLQTHRHEIRLRHSRMWRVHRDAQWRTCPLLCHPRLRRSGATRDDHRRFADEQNQQNQPKSRQSGASRLGKARRGAMRLLPIRPDHVGRSAPCQQSPTNRCRY